MMERRSLRIRAHPSARITRPPLALAHVPNLGERAHVVKWKMQEATNTDQA